MRSIIHHDVALPALALTDIVVHRDAARRLHNAPEAAAIGGAKLRQPESEAAIRQGAIFRTVMAVDAAGVIARRRLIAQRGRRRIVFASRTSDRVLGLAGLGRLQQSKPIFTLGRGDLLSLRWQRRASAH